MQRSFFSDCARATAQADALQVEQTKMLYAGLPTALVINALLALILASVQSAVIGHVRSLVWIAVIGVTLLARMVLVMAWRRSQVDVAYRCSCWMHLFRISVILTGMAWGAGAILLFPLGDDLHQVFLAFVLAGMSAGAITLLAVDRVSMLGFLIPTLTPLAAAFTVEGDAVAHTMAAMVALFLFFIAANATGVGRSLLENFRLRIKAVEDERDLALVSCSS